MPQGSDETELRGNSEQGDWVHGKKQNKPSILHANLSRRKLFGLGLGGVVGAVAMRFGLIDRMEGPVSKVAEAVSNLPDPREKLVDGPTKEQEEAFSIFKENKGVKIISGLTVTGRPEEDRVLATVYNRPSLLKPIEPGSPIEGKPVVVIEAGAKIPEAFIVEGTNPKLGSIYGSKDNWVFVPGDSPRRSGFVRIDDFNEYIQLSREENPVKLKSFHNNPK